MNFKTFLAMLQRDAHVARRNFIALLVQTLLQPMMFVFIFGRVMTSSGFMPPEYKSLLLPGIIAISMVISGAWAVAMPLISEFQFTKEIEDRLLAPLEIEWLAIEKVVAGMVQALVAGLVVIPTAWFIMGKGVELSGDHIALFTALALLVSLLASAVGLTLGSSVAMKPVPAAPRPTHIHSPSGPRHGRELMPSESSVGAVRKPSVPTSPWPT